ncbi:polysaccharide biosynthesis protein [Prevotella copri]|uniref:Polysaccharide biosynthesis protein n=1 Tax=Segatella copri TaxID=165179 RepID=A0A6A7VY48_9BACT|nr:nucleoside-diphosphate sugar epimerase/dehydratase [Segatella copri]MCW4101430.1 polysaccharide biosynthesis protein [Segatella copri]MQM58452.1 polysaccharide biosynthesis protein [Segatella copri]MQN05870.1 polysaccharide biosynthesis protein [Segatella copri]MQN10237.1 polysaccharide biosynthesis protein [Segatella copri]MQO61249.1 polysaccharide biosynthesis protein [Segatella copri]
MKFFNRLSNWYFSKKSLPYWCIFWIDCAVTFVSYLFIYQQINSGAKALSILGQLSMLFAIFTLFHAIGFRIFHTYDGILRYSSFIDLQRVFYAVTFGAVLSAITKDMLLSTHFFPGVEIEYRNIVLGALISTLVLWAIRVIAKTIFDVSLSDYNIKHAFIYGVKEGGIGLAKQIKNSKPMKFKLMGFISDDAEIKHHHLMGTKVYAPDQNTIRKMRNNNISTLLISPGAINVFRANKDFQDALLAEGIHIYMPTTQEWNRNEQQQLKEVSIEDLLPRDEISIDMESVGSMLHGKRILITGSAGSIGSEMVRQIAKYSPAELILIDSAETPQHDIRLMMAKQFPDIKAETIVTTICSKSRMEHIFKTYLPDYVFHAAAYKHVPMMENNPCESIQNNVYGTKILADLAVKYGVKKFVMISTDKAVNPTNVMGCSKRICEIYVQSLNKAIEEGIINGKTQFVTTRFGNVLGSNGSVIPLFKKQIKAGGPVTVTDPRIIRYFMLIPEACKLVLEAGTKGNGGEIFVFDMGKPVKIADMAQRMINLSGAKNVEIKYTGLRAGEKLYEEVLNEKESTKPSFHDKIRIAEVREYDYTEVSKQIDDLIEKSKLYDEMLTVKIMKEIVPEYKSNNSIYEKLDK